MYYVGEILSTHGIKGELKVKSDSSFDRFKEGNILYADIKGEYKKITINSHRKHNEFELITFNDFTNINQVLDYVGCKIYIKEHDRAKDKIDVYYEDLINSKIYDEENKIIGEVNDIIELPKGILLEVFNGDKKALIPYVDEFVKEVNVKEKKIIIHLIEGLIPW